MSNTLKTTLKFLVSAAALGFVFYNIDVRETWNVIRGASPWWLLAAVVVYVLSQMLSSERVRRMLSAIGVDVHWWVNMKLYWLGMFYNFFLPGGVGGDGYKVYWLHKRRHAQVRPAVMAMLGDRMSGLAAICIYTLCYAAVRPGAAESLGWHSHIGQYWMLCFIPVGLWLYWLFFRLLQRQLMWVSFKALAYSFVIQGLQMVSAALILEALDATGLIWDYLFLFLLSSIASAIPATLGGVGARETAFAIGSTYLGIEQPFAISLSLLFYAVSLVGALPGAVLAAKSNLIDGEAVPRPEGEIDFGAAIEAASDDVSEKSADGQQTRKN